MSSSTSPIVNNPALTQTVMNRSFVCSPEFITDIYENAFEININSLFFGSAGNTINKLYWYPFPVNLGYTNYIYDLDTPIGKITKSQGDFDGCQPLTSYARFGYDISAGAIPIEAKYGDFRDYPPYTRITAYLPYYGTVELNPRDVIGKFLRVILTVDFNTGVATYGLYTQEDATSVLSGNAKGFSNTSTYSSVDRHIDSYEFQLGVEMPLSLIDGVTPVRQALSIASGILSPAMGSLSGIGSVSRVSGGSENLPLENPHPEPLLPSGAPRLNPVTSMSRRANVTDLNDVFNTPCPTKETLSVTGTVDLQRLFKNSSIALATMHPVNIQHGSGSGHSNYTAPNSVGITYYRMKFTEEPDTEYGENFGYPYGKSVTQIADMQGYTVIGSYNPNGKFSSATQTEKTMLDKAILNGLRLPYTYKAATLSFPDGTIESIKYINGQTWREWISCGGNKYAVGAYVPSKYILGATRKNIVAVNTSAGVFYRYLFKGSNTYAYLDDIISSTEYSVGADD